MCFEIVQPADSNVNFDSIEAYVYYFFFHFEKNLLKNETACLIEKQHTTGLNIQVPSDKMGQKDEWHRFENTQEKNE